jgi:hypothetical protein
MAQVRKSEAKDEKCARPKQSRAWMQMITVPVYRDQNEAKIPYVVVLKHRLHNMLSQNPTIPGEVPRTTCILRTTT